MHTRLSCAWRCWPGQDGVDAAAGRSRSRWCGGAWRPALAGRLSSGPTPGSPPTVKQPPRRDPHALRLAGRQPGPPGEPGGRRPGAEARRHEGRLARPRRGSSSSRSTRVPWPGSGTGALLSVMLYSFARVSAVLGMRWQDYFRQGARGWLRLHEKGGKRHDVPAYHRAAEASIRFQGRQESSWDGGRMGELFRYHPVLYRVHAMYTRSGSRSSWGVGKSLYSRGHRR